MEKEKIQFKIRPATLRDCLTMAYIIQIHANAGLMLERSIDQLTLLLANYFVAEIDRIVIGTCGMKFWPRNGVEIISSAVVGEFRKKGIGSALNSACIKKARLSGFKQVFTLTKQSGFYAKLGFKEFPKEEIEEKIWSECRFCKVKAGFAKDGLPICDEIAMRLILK